MATDFSRVRLNPLLDYAGVELKQGAVLLDADANELVGILDRRLRALASDVLDRARVSSTTKDAFKIDVSGSTLSIRKGRLYVDGLLAENHGARSADPAKRMFDPLLAETAFVDPILYPAQPYMPAPPPPLPTSGRHLVYLDVWDREVTAIEQPDLVEPAVGVEASSRIQTVWQVRVLANDAGTNTTCASPDTDFPGWADAIAPSTGVLSSGTFAVAPTDDPCELPPTGGYRGLENQLYRVEIHDPGQPGAGATFKWSRENASVASRVISMVSDSKLQLASIGRDDVLSFKTGDWVEIIDDSREFSQVAGEMRKITVTGDVIEFAPALPVAMLPSPANFPNSTFPVQRNLRVRRWDQSGRIFRTDSSGTPVEVQDLNAAGSTGVIAVPVAATTLLLEDGVTVRFDSTGAAGFKAGDYWVFAARTTDASVELLDRAPPRGVHHHFARLGIWDATAGTVTDCRNPWPPPAAAGHDCGCTACVTADQHASGQFTIQDAVNQVAETGGTVCLGPGRYALREPVRLTGVTSVRVRGQGPASLIVAPGAAFIIRTSVAVGIESLAIVSLGQQPAITVDTALGFALERTLLAMLGSADRAASAIALLGVIAAARIIDNAVFAAVGILANDPTAPRDEGQDQTPVLLTADLNIDDNILWCRQRAVALDGNVMHLLSTSIAGNDVLACTETGVSATGIGLAGSSMAICRNSLSVAGSGIRCAADGIWISDNKLARTAPAADAIGISLVTGLGKNGADQCQLLANQISGFTTAGILIAAPVRDLIVKLNIITDCGNGIVSAGAGNAGSLAIENNLIRNVSAATDSATTTLIAIGVLRAASAHIAGNTIRTLGVQAVQSALRVGILTLGVDRTLVAGNEVAELAPPGDFVGRAAGILLLAPLVDFAVSENRVERDIVVSNVRSNGEWNALVVRDSDPQVPATHVGNFATVRFDTAKTLVLGAGRPFVSTLAATPTAAEQLPGANGSILGNVLNARGDAPAVDLVAAQCLFNDNRVDARLNSKAAVTLAAPIIIVNGNRVTGNELSIQITRATAKTAAILGNITTRAIALSGGPVPPPFDALNLHA